MTNAIPLLTYRHTTGWFEPESSVIHCPSPNYDERPPNTMVDLLVIHSISLPPGEFGGSGVIDLFQNQLDCSKHPFYKAHLMNVRVSAHGFIRRDGTLIQSVSCLHRAWHSGSSQFGGRDNCNDFSIGIELEGIDDSVEGISPQPFMPAQYAMLVGCIKALQPYFLGITPEHIVGHSDIAPERKKDPGPGFDWTYFRTLLLSSLNTYSK
ncbi:MAG: 1,6-anhydro-N-acetylmuramyl-L-alanine amidase AmpD [Gammaproteobacteria bacterium]